MLLKDHHSIIFNLVDLVLILIYEVDSHQLISIAISNVVEKGQVHSDKMLI